jgi:hypothetical protein
MRHALNLFTLIISRLVELFSQTTKLYSARFALPHELNPIADLTQTGVLYSYRSIHWVPLSLLGCGMCCRSANHASSSASSFRSMTAILTSSS